MKRLSLLLFILIAQLHAHGQSQQYTETTLWYRLHATKSISQGMTAAVLIEDRKFLNPWRSHIFLTEVSLKQRFWQDWAFGLHGTYLIFALPHDPDIRNTLRMNEARVHQSITFPKWHVGEARICNRLMAEQRFFQTELADGQMGSFDYTFLRFRHLLKVTIPITHQVDWIVSEEPMIQAGKDGEFQFDQNRAGTSAMIKVTNQIAIELGYLHWYQTRPGIRYTRHSLRTGLYVKF